MRKKEKNMGVYVFRSKHEPYIKVGHYQGKNVWSRIAHRGFSSCVCPLLLVDRVTYADMELVGWFPNLTKKEESNIKRKWKDQRIYGKSEWFPLSCETDIMCHLETLDPNQSHLCCLETALATRRRL